MKKKVSAKRKATAKTMKKVGARKKATAKTRAGPSYEELWGVSRALPFSGEKRWMLGYWGPDEPELPDPETLVDPDWSAAIRGKVVRYLSRRAFLLSYAAAGWSVCRFCLRTNGNQEMSDGRYVWPDGLAHYVRDHEVRLPDAVVAHILAAKDPGGPLHRARNDRIGWESFPNVPPWIAAKLKAAKPGERVATKKAARKEAAKKTARRAATS